MLRRTSSPRIACHALNKSAKVDTCSRVTIDQRRDDSRSTSLGIVVGKSRRARRCGAHLRRTRSLAFPRCSRSPRTGTSCSRCLRTPSVSPTSRMSRRFRSVLRARLFHRTPTRRAAAIFRGRGRLHARASGRPMDPHRGGGRAPVARLARATGLSRRGESCAHFADRGLGSFRRRRDGRSASRDRAGWTVPGQARSVRPHLHVGGR